MRKRILVIAAATMFFAASGCVGIMHERAPQSWPRPISAANAKAFEGVFSNQSVDRVTGQPREQASQLFDFLTGQGHAHAKRGTRVEIRSSPDHKALHVRLLDEQRVEIDSASLQDGADFELSRGYMILHGHFSGLHADSGNLGTGVKHQSTRLHVSSTSDLLGRRTEKEAGLLFYLLPVIGSSKSWMLWPKLASPAESL